ncbi:MAG: hypothetical protein ACK43M_14605 [Allorhizobium sp.]
MSERTNPDTVLAKLVDQASGDVTVADVLEVALTKLPWREDEATAARLLNSILFHDQLLETLDAYLDAPPEDDGVASRGSKRSPEALRLIVMDFGVAGAIAAGYDQKQVAEIASELFGASHENAP